MMEQFRDMSTISATDPGTVEDIKHGLQEDKKDWGAFLLYAAQLPGCVPHGYVGIWSAAAGPFIFWSAP